mmetsp:Transcript_68216/g.171892  ORF Transcript_68216/g.171892 Transcript_68216/m.171892 type:complete len:202 (-) Transcript_68216:1748-2353(-)
MPSPFSVSAALAIKPEWKAFCTCTLVHFRPAAFKSASSASTAATSPEITACIGEFTAASHKPGRSPLLTVANSSSVHSATDNMAPSSANVSVDFARAATIATADSNVSKPPATAAAYSPREWPATVIGITPTARRTWHNECSMTKRLGCVTVGRANCSSLSPASSGSPEKMIGRRSKPRCSGADNSSQHLSATERNNGTCS